VLSRVRSALKNVAKISAIHGLYGKDKQISFDLSMITRCFVISVNNYTIKNCRICNTFYFEAARRVEGNYVKTRTNNLRIFHANGHERLGGKCGAGVRGPGVWKTRGVENAGSGGKRGVPFFSPKCEFSSVK